MGLASLIGIVDVISGFKELPDLTFRIVAAKLGPILFIVVMLPGYVYIDRLLKRWIPDRKVVRGIYGTALSFGMVHSSIWPTPIPLFVLGLALGYLAYRTQTLLGPILLHSLFNAVACLTLVFPHVFPDWPKGREETSAPTRSVPTATSTRVPGSWQLRWRKAKAITPPSRGDLTELVTSPISLLSNRTLDPRGASFPCKIFRPRKIRLT